MASQDVSGELPEALWRRFGSSWGALGALFGSVFSVKSSSLQFQIEKRTRNVFQLDEVYKASCFKPQLRKNPVANASKELVFVLSQRKIRCVAISFFGVGGSGRRPLESADPWSRRGGRRRGTLSSRR